MIIRGRTLDPISLWEKYVDFPVNMPTSGFSPLVVCPNPEHDTNKRHFQINLDKPLVHCFADCGISGTYEKAIAMIEGVTEREARRLIVKSTSVSSGTPTKRGAGNNRGRGQDGRPDDKNLAPPSLDFSRRIPEYALDYLADRGIDDASVATWGLGFDHDERRIVIPADDERAIPRFLIKRAIRKKDFPKYLYWPEKEACGWGKSDLLFGACQIDPRAVRSTGLVLVEGSLDVIRLYQHGFRNVGAILGTKLSRRQAQIIQGLSPRRVYCMFDKDIAGWHNIQSVEQTLRKVPISVCLYPIDKRDPAEMSRREAHTSVENAIPLVKFKQRLPKALRRRELAHGT